MRTLYYSHFQLYVSFLLFSYCSASHSFSMKSVSSFFGAQPFTEEVAKEYPLDPQGELTIKNITGNIGVKTWSKGAVLVKAIKRASNQDELPLIAIKTNHQPDTVNASLTIATTYAHKDLRGSVDYMLIIPEHAKLHVATTQGSISINESTGPINVSTIDGNIKIFNTTDAVTAKTHHKGNIIIGHARGPINAAARKGNIIVENAQNSISAQTQRGNLGIDCRHVPESSSIMLVAESGAITLALPESTSAAIRGKTNHGTITCAHQITLKPQTTTLDPKAWTRFKREIEGTIGTTPEADIRLMATNGNIKIMKHVTT